MDKKSKVSKPKPSFHKQVKTHCSLLIEISDSDEEDDQDVIKDLTPTDQLLKSSDSDDEDVQLFKDHNTTPAGGSRNQLRSRDVVVEKKAESDDDDVESDNDMISEEIHPSFIITLKEYHKSAVAVPKKFIDAAGFHNKKAVVLQYPPNQSLWSVLLVYHPSQARFQMSAGWWKFRNNNGLEFEKTYLFEYVRDTNVIEVKLIPTDENNNISTLRSWKFSKKLQKHNFTTRRLDVPKGFVNGSGISKSGEIILEDAQGRKWPVKLTDRNLGKFGFTAGWKGFLDANKNMVVGSTILFEFIPNSGNVIRARLIKR